MSSAIKKGALKQMQAFDLLSRNYTERKWTSFMGRINSCEQGETIQLDISSILMVVWDWKYFIIKIEILF